jgi:hypothetical protein
MQSGLLHMPIVQDDLSFRLCRIRWDDNALCAGENLKEVGLA